jgi:hypothetical protein
MNNGRYQWLLNIDLGGGNEVGLDTAYDFTFEPSWKCVEWHIDGGSKRYQFWYEGNKVIDGSLSQIPGSFYAIGFGVNGYAGNGARTEGFIDDIVISQSQIGCDSGSSSPAPTPPSGTPSTPSNCVATGADCRSSKCCLEAGMTCYEKDAYWGSCRTSCTPGIWAEEPEQWRTSWTCTALGKPTPSTPAPTPAIGNPGDTGILINASDRIARSGISFYLIVIACTAVGLNAVYA